MSMLLLALLLQGAPVRATTIGIDDPVDCAATPGALACRKGPARYRLEGDEDESFDRKSDGLRATGAPCGLIGLKLCTRKPRTILSTAPKE
ncbi:hypothetical protein [Sphingomonas sp. VNH70]|uniref:hypothetical protein n=1 Tax=Sphingomonas silueang TaxID=3156617 RepID=UPI0032B3ED07